MKNPAEAGFFIYSANYGSEKAIDRAPDRTAIARNIESAG